MRTDDELRTLIAQGYKQISARYRILARLPEGKTGINALVEAEMAAWQRRGSIKPDYWPDHYVKWANQLGEIVAGNYFRRVWAKDDLRVTLSPIELRRFRHLGGLSA